jgi:PAS domain S-box-containing protein
MKELLDKDYSAVSKYIIQENQEIIKYLKESRLFVHLPKELLYQLLPLSKILELPPNTEILKEGKANDKVFFLVRGEVLIKAGGQSILTLRRTGDVFGEMSIISDKLCSATVMAQTAVKIFSIQAKNIGKYTDIETDKIHHALYRIFAMVLTDKLCLTTLKAKEYEVTHNNLLQEIALHKKTSLALIESEELFSKVFQMNPNPMAVLAIDDGRYLMVNQAFLSTFDLHLDEVIGKACREIEFLDGDQEKQSILALLKADEFVKDKEFTTKKKSGDRLVGSISAEIIKLKKREFVLTIMNDITQRKQVEEELKKHKENLETVVNLRTAELEGANRELKESQKYFKAMFEQAAVGVVQLKSKTGEFVKVNKKYAEIVGYTQAELLTSDFMSITHPEDLQVDLNNMERLKKGEITDFTSEKRYFKKDGKMVWVKLTVSPLWQPGEVPNYHIAVINDITDRKLAEIELRKSKEEAEKANNAKSEFLSNMSHEIRTPMHQILSYSQFGISKIEKVNADKLLQYFSIINGTGERLMGLLDNLLDLSKIEAGKMELEIEQIDFMQILNIVVREFSPDLEENSITLKIIEKEVPTIISCDEYKTRQVIQNLLSNAIKFSPNGKQIDVLIEQGELLAGKRKTDHSDPALLISVSDQGVGIPDDELVSIFDKFTQSSKTKTGAGGTGLGLAICDEIISAHKGKIWAENNLAGGATFKVLLPY